MNLPGFLDVTFEILLLSESYLKALIYIKKFNIQVTISEIRLPVFIAIQNGYSSLKSVVSFRTMRQIISKVLSPGQIWAYQLLLHGYQIDVMGVQQQKQT